MDLTRTTRNADLVLLDRPKRLTLAEFEDLDVSPVDRATRDLIYELEGCLHADPNSFVNEAEDCRPVHRFVAGLYHRELTIPADRVIVGKRHAVEHVVMLTAGSCTCITERGYEVMTAPLTFISPAGEKRVVITNQGGPCTWVTLHPTKQTDLDEIERDVIIAEPERQARYLELRAQAQKELEMNEHIQLGTRAETPGVN